MRASVARFPTLVHGDAKLANFLFTEDHTEVAAVDFQYVGRGCAMKDVAYFLGSCLSGEACERMEEPLLQRYFEALPSLPLVSTPGHWSRVACTLPLAWADFERFMQGWSPGHRKLTEHSDATTERAIEAIADAPVSAARDACLAAGRFIQANAGKVHEVNSRGLRASLRCRYSRGSAGSDDHPRGLGRDDDAL